MHKISLISVFLIFIFYFSGLHQFAFAEGQKDRKSGNSSDMDMLIGDVEASLSQMDGVFGAFSTEMTPEDEYYLGRAVAAEIIKEYKPFIASRKLTDYLNRICMAITINSSRPTLFSGYYVEILDTDEICAFASSGGHIFVSRGLIKSAASEDVLAAVIAHEVAHIQKRHITAILSSERTIQELSSVSDRATSIASRNLTEKERTVLFQESLSVYVNTLFRDGYSREQEFEADKMAQELLFDAGYDPAALKEILEVLEKNTQPGNMSKTHPTPAMRMARLESYKFATGRETRSVRRSRFNEAVK